MSTLWTPDGEKPIRRQSDESAGHDPSGLDSAFAEDTGDLPIDEQAMVEQVEEMRKQLAESPVEVVIANHCYGLFELSAVYLSQIPPLLPQARVAIDALAALVDGLQGRLGEAEPQLNDGLGQLRLAFVQIDGAQRAGQAVAATGHANGTPENQAAATDHDEPVDDGDSAEE